MGQSFVLEFILTFVLMLVILGSAVHGKATKSFAGLAIGSTVGLEAIFAGPICGASMNPARSIFRTRYCIRQYAFLMDLSAVSNRPLTLSSKCSLPPEMKALINC
ncbi:aquaporin [Paenibacillus filicis]|uniref:Aquaporin n=1 Tax=Paenibacillus filicis TaxID=669464 RepID=A0ABU9DIY3_9BACL